MGSAPEVSTTADDPAATRGGYGTAPAAEAPKPRPSAPVAQRPAPAPVPAAAAASEKTAIAKRETPIWTYVGVGVIFGASLIGIYQLVGLLAH